MKLKTILCASLLALSSPALALRSPPVNPGPIQRQSYWSADLATAPAGLYVKAFDVIGTGPTLYHYAGGGVYVLGPNGSMSPFVAADWPDTLWVQTGTGVGL